MTLRLVLGLAALALATDALADEPDPRLRYRVTGVQQPDSLKVRKDGGLNAPVVGELDVTKTTITVTGRTRGKWWEVIGGTATGWVHSKFLSPVSEAREDNFPLNCFGTEPFWGLEVSGAKASFTTIAGEVEKLPLTASGWIKARGLIDRFVIRFDGPPKAPNGYLSVLSMEQRCSDNMSEDAYPYHATLIGPNGEVYGGCCVRAP